MNKPKQLLFGAFALAAIGLATMVRFVDATAPPAHVANGSHKTTASISANALSSLAIPVSGMTADQLVDNFSDRRDDDHRGHDALDIPAPRGSPVIAAAAGTIEKIFESNAGGHTVYIRTTDGHWIHYYAHLDAYAPDLREGMSVAQGQIIGTVGSTGNANAAAPHLHIEIKRMAVGEKWYEGQSLNPYPLLAGGHRSSTGLKNRS